MLFECTIRKYIDLIHGTSISSILQELSASDEGTVLCSVSLAKQTGRFSSMDFCVCVSLDFYFVYKVIFGYRYNGLLLGSQGEPLGILLVKNYRNGLCISAHRLQLL
jgi:hypothetical protein